MHEAVRQIYELAGPRAPHLQERNGADKAHRAGDVDA